MKNFLFCSLFFSFTCFGQGEFINIDSSGSTTPGALTTNGVISIVNAGQTGAVIYTNRLSAYGATAWKWAFGALAVSNNPVVAFTSSNFVAGDIGKVIFIDGAGFNRRGFWTGISNVLAPNQIVLSNSVYLSYSNALPGNVAALTAGYNCAYGYDSSAAVQTWVNQWSNAVPPDVFFNDVGVVAILNPPQLTNQNNAQIIIPARGQENMGPRFKMIGRSAPAWNYFNNKFAPLNYEAGFLSNLQGANWTGTNRCGASVFDFRPFANPAYVMTDGSIYVPSAGMREEFDDLSFITGYDANCCVLNLLGAGEVGGGNLFFFSSTINGSSLPAPLGTNGFAMIMPNNYEGSYGYFYDIVSINSFMNGVDAGIFNFDHLFMSGCSNCFTCRMTGGSGVGKVNHFYPAACANWIDTVNRTGTWAPDINVDVYARDIYPGNTPDWLTNAPQVIGYNGHSTALNFGSKVTVQKLGEGPRAVVTDADDTFGQGTAFWYKENYGNAEQDSTPKVWRALETFNTNTVFVGPMKSTGGAIFNGVGGYGNVGNPGGYSHFGSAYFSNTVVQTCKNMTGYAVRDIQTTSAGQVYDVWESGSGQVTWQPGIQDQSGGGGDAYPVDDFVLSPFYAGNPTWDSGYAVPFFWTTNGTTFSPHYAGNFKHGHPVLGLNTNVLGAAATVTADASASDSSGTVTIATGVVVPSATGIFTNTYATPYKTAPHIVWTPANTAAAQLSGATTTWPDSATSSSLKFIVWGGATGLATSTTYIWTYKVEQ